MSFLVGEHQCKLDSKGRTVFPMKMRKQLETVIHHGLVINRDIFSKSLVMYPQPEWEKVLSEMRKLSRYDEEHQRFMEKFVNGANLLELDDTGRILIPSSLLHYAQIDLKASNEVVMVGLIDKIKIWSHANYQKYVVDDDTEMRAMAKKIGRDIQGGLNVNFN